MTYSKNPFERDTKNSRIFDLAAPYANEYQGPAGRWLFVCSAGLLRSPTGAAVAINNDINARACGSHIEYALIPISANLIMWADKIIFVSPENYGKTLDVFANTGYEEDINSKCFVMNIPDVYNYMDPNLVSMYEDTFFKK